MSGAKNGNTDVTGTAANAQQQQQQQQPGPPVPGAPTVTLIRTATATAVNAEKGGGDGQQQQQQQRGARPFDAAASNVEAPASGQSPASTSTAVADALTPPPFKPYQRQTRINWAGSAAFLFYLGALAFYLWVRITKTLDLGKYTAVRRRGKSLKGRERETFDFSFFTIFGDVFFFLSLSLLVFLTSTPPFLLFLSFRLLF